MTGSVRRSAAARSVGAVGVACALIIGCAGTETTGSISTATASVAAASAEASPVDSAVASPRSTNVAAPGTAAGLSGLPIDPKVLSGRIAFSYDDGIWVANADGSDRRCVSSDGGFDPTFSPDGSQIAYRLLLATDDGEIWVMDADGRNRHDLVNDPEFSDWGPAWSPDGRHIAFDSNRRVGLAIWSMNADGSDQHIVTQGHGEYPSWSPDSNRLAYSGGDYYDIRVVDADGSDDVALTTSPAYDMGPAWSPDGMWIAYHTQADYYPNLGEAGMGPEMEIHLVRPDGSDDHRITMDRVEDGFATWSPDSRYLMWARHGQLVVARPDGTGLVDIGPGNFPTWIP